MPDTHLTKQDLAARWQVCERTIQRWVRRFKIKALVFDNGSKRWRLSEVEVFEKRLLSGLVTPTEEEPAAQCRHAGRANRATRAETSAASAANTARRDTGAGAATGRPPSASRGNGAVRPANRAQQ